MKPFPDYLINYKLVLYILDRAFDRNHQWPWKWDCISELKKKDLKDYFAIEQYYFEVMFGFYKYFKEKYGTWSCICYVREFPEVNKGYELIGYPYNEVKKDYERVRKLARVPPQFLTEEEVKFLILSDIRGLCALTQGDTITGALMTPSDAEYVEWMILPEYVDIKDIVNVEIPRVIDFSEDKSYGSHIADNRINYFYINDKDILIKNIESIHRLYDSLFFYMASGFNDIFLLYFIKYECDKNLTNEEKSFLDSVKGKHIKLFHREELQKLFDLAIAGKIVVEVLDHNGECLKVFENTIAFGVHFYCGRNFFRNVFPCEMRKAIKVCGPVYWESIYGVRSTMNCFDFLHVDV